MNFVARAISRRTFASTRPVLGKVFDLGDKSEISGILQESPNLLVDFHASWCGPCKMMDPWLKNVIAQEDDVNLLKIDVDEFEDISLDFQVRAMPTVVFLKNGDEVNRFVGARDESGIKEFIVNSMER
ncbi:Oidioi.mRNA.OKI2018_I69.chr2.g6060.t1.cds [Oikopleura dioica]|uniref:Oidioi.mRNA.OKI2018_I69.chr2.g6060.t1.cds n=1 Tax=Oikopleura dioica TaxID=34765 RepID=A0ABN7T2T0_OIKDI|nr:Oidioi.mRNA.OKI2018_I69.chr2.g6060.t1.cds [Oikopleura dioica]